MAGCVLFGWAPAAVLAETPSGETAALQVARVLVLSDYNTRLVVLSTAMLGLAAGLIGTFLLLRKRSLIGDAVSHATLPGIALAFMFMVWLGTDGKSLLGLLIGAGLSGLVGVSGVILIRGVTRLHEDTAMGIVLSVFFGFGVALLGMVQDMPQGSAAGLESFIYGKTASIVFNDAILIGMAAVGVTLVCLLFSKELALLCFDEGYARAQGWPVASLDALMLLLVTIVTVIGLQSVGLILVIALFMIPPAAARFWTHHLPTTMFTAALIGAVSGWLGASISAVSPRLPAGAVIVVVSAVIFVMSMIFGTSRGVLRRTWRHWKLTQNIGRQHLLRACYERLEAHTFQATGQTQPSVFSAEWLQLNDLLTMRSWTLPYLRRLLAMVKRQGLVDVAADGRFRLSSKGVTEAARMVRNHRLWEIYLITHADIAPSHVDRDADQIEHVLGTELVAKLETLLETQTQESPVPYSPHQLSPGGV